MSVVAIRAALETQLNSIAPAIATAWQNVAFAPPPVATPYQEVHVLFADPENPEMSAGYREIGYMQVKLKYEIEKGSAAANARAILVRNAFLRGRSFVNSGVTVTVSKTPTIEGGSVDGDRWVVPVKIQFFANLF
jgi:hypothetical protein